MELGAKIEGGGGPWTARLRGLVRPIAYSAIWLLYLSFMSSHAPKGIAWLPAHAQRIFNAVEYLKVNGYFASWGYSIWSACQDCGLSAAEWVGKIYLSGLALKMVPYLALNHFWGADALLQFGPWVDRMVIFVAAVAAAEVGVLCLRDQSRLAPDWIGVACFSLFVTTPWTYKMLLSSWVEIYFLMFFLLGLLGFAHARYRLGCAMFLLAAGSHNHWAAAVAGLYGLLFVLSRRDGADDGVRRFFPPFARRPAGCALVVASLLVPVVLETGLRILASRELGSGAGSSLLTRIGVAGNDIHNGGLLGALQFLGGQRITTCFAGDALGAVSKGIGEAIGRYNCVLSISGMGVLSIASIVGLVFLVKKSAVAKWAVFPLMYAMLLFVTVLQQSLSVHLLGYSFVFSFLFAAGMAGLMVRCAQAVRSPAVALALCLPCVLGVVLLSVRVSMVAAGANG